MCFSSCIFWQEGEEKPAANMDAIKKKMQAMKMEKDSAMDKADTCEQQAKDANGKADKVTCLGFISRR